jgi:hypothetical protein
MRRMTWDEWFGFALLGAGVLFLALRVFWRKKKGSPRYYKSASDVLVFIFILSIWLAVTWLNR